jgi:dipeptidyl aminopeptidase/acylaminoacyl peptidase
MKRLIILLIFSLLINSNYLLSIDSDRNNNKLLEENKKITEISTRLAQLYKLDNEELFKDITKEVLASPDLSIEARNALTSSNRQIYLFWYPSDGLKIKGFISYVPNAESNPLLILLRGGNREFALLHPGTTLASYKNYTVVSTTYRGGVSEGRDEFGGADVNDVKNLMDFIPHLTELLHIPHPTHTYMMGFSRGGMQMFLALSRFPELQWQVEKIVSLSGILDIQQQIQVRPDMKQMFQDDFGYSPESDCSDWVDQRNPILTTSLIRTDLPILIIQGTKDDRVSLFEGYQMIQSLNNHQVTYKEIDDGNHGLFNIPNRMQIIGEWLETRI